MTGDRTLGFEVWIPSIFYGSDSRRWRFAGWISRMAMFLAWASSIKVDSASIYMDKGTRLLPVAKGSLTQDIWHAGSHYESIPSVRRVG